MSPQYKPTISSKYEKSIISVIGIPKPAIFSSRDYGVQHFSIPRTLGQGMLVGMMGMTYPQDIDIIISV